MIKDRLKSSVFLKSKKALLRLLNGTPFDAISVKDICNEANFSRQYFYRYYIDKMDLVRDIFLEDISRGMGVYFSLKKSTTGVLSELQNNGKFYHALFTSSYYAESYRLMHLVNTICLKTLYKTSNLQAMPTELLPLLDFYSHGICVTIAQSFVQNKPYDPPKLMELFNNSLPPALEKLNAEEITGELMIYHVNRELEHIRNETKAN